MEQGGCEDLSEASSGTDASSYASSFDEDESVEGRSTPDASPRPQEEPAGVAHGLPPLPVPPTAGQLSPKRMPKPKIPALGLRPELQRGPGSATPRSQPESARGRPACAIPRLPTAPRPCGDAAMDQSVHDEPPLTARHAIGAGQGLMASIACAPDRCDGLGVPASTLTVGLLSPALTVSSVRGDLQTELLAARVLSRVGQALGVQQRELTLFEVREVPNGAQPSPNAACMAVAVKGSDFSLGALERLLKDNAALRAEADAAAAQLDSARHGRHNAEALVASLQEAKGRQAQERCRTLESDNALLREQLKRSNALRARGQRALEELRGEFEALTRDLAGGDAAATLTLASPGSDVSTPELLKTPKAPSSARSTRIANVLEKLSDEAVLSRLEQCFSQAGL